MAVTADTAQPRVTTVGKDGVPKTQLFTAAASYGTKKAWVAWDKAVSDHAAGELLFAVWVEGGCVVRTLGGA